jgi:hypothetical protein
MSDHPTNTTKTNLFLWILIACLFVSIVGSISIFFLLGDKLPTRKTRNVVHSTTTSSNGARAPGKAPTSFAELTEADVRITAAGYYVISIKETIPFSEATPSPTGTYWRCQWGGSRKCFFAPPSQT